MIDRREQRRLETQQRLLDAAEQVLSAKGYEEASILDITEAANVSKRTFYLHFTDKEAIIEALAMQRFADLRQQAEAHGFADDEHTEHFRDHFRDLTQLIFEFAASNNELMRISFGSGGSYRLQAMAREFLATAWEENMMRKCNYQPNAPVPPTILANALAGIVFQLLCWWSQHPNDCTPTQMAAMCTSILFDGIHVNLVGDNSKENACT
jgi:AcrR family transcriptional regulator